MGKTLESGPYGGPSKPPQFLDPLKRVQMVKKSKNGRILSKTGSKNPRKVQKNGGVYF